MAESSVRRRKIASAALTSDHFEKDDDSDESEDQNSSQASSNNSSYDSQHIQESADEETIFFRFITRLNVLLGLAVMVIIAAKYAEHLKQLHENEMFFSNIKEVEREISFRTESGLYYSYYKQFVAASSISQGLYEMTHDNLTEHPSTINVLARMNIYQEVVMACIYKTFTAIQTSYEPVYLYINTVFCLQGVMLCALYLITWVMSGTWVSSVLFAAFYIFNREDITRVHSSVPLRENWSLPFFYLQMLGITCYLKPSKPADKQVLCRMFLVVTTFLFALTWQFNQFVLFLQAAALFACQLLNLLPHRKILTLYMTQLLSMLLVCGLQFGNPMIPSGLLFSFVPAACFIMFCQNKLMPVCHKGVISSVFKVLVYIMMALLLMKLVNMTFKVILNQEADEHIYRFILAKFGWANPRDFDVSLYLCNGAFNFMSPDTFTRLSYKLVFPVYVLTHIILLTVIAVDVLHRWSDAPHMEPKELDSLSSFPDRPELNYHAIQCVLYAFLALSTMRMKYFWTPYMCVLASTALADTHCWRGILGYLRCHSNAIISIVKHLALLLVLASLLYITLPPALRELEDLKEFYDPDTVELMEWIKSSTPVTGAFSGSMQLLAGVKLCTGRPITNHPHYEDKGLRLKTRELYLFYGRASPDHIHRVLSKHEADYVILEDSICLSPRQGCRTTDIVDLTYNIVPEGGHSEPGLLTSDLPRFCDEVRHQGADYAQYFQLVFQNKTFRVYRVLR